MTEPHGIESRLVKVWHGYPDWRLRKISLRRVTYSDGSEAYFRDGKKIYLSRLGSFEYFGGEVCKPGED